MPFHSSEGEEEEDFIQEDEESESDGEVDEMIQKLSEEHKVIQEQQSTITALRSAGIHRPITPGYKTQYVARKHTQTHANTRKYARKHAQTQYARKHTSANTQT